MATSIELRQQRASVWEAAKAINDRAETDNRDLSAEEKTAWGKANDDLDALDSRIERQERMERTASQREPERVPEAKTEGEPDAEERRAIFWRGLGQGVNRLSERERAVMQSFQAELSPEMRALSSAVDTAGGYLVPEEAMRPIREAMVSFGGMRNVASVITTNTGANLPWPTNNDTGNVGRLIGENAAVAENDVTFGAVIMQAHMYSSDMIRVPYVLLQDSGFDLESFIARKLGERIGRITNTHFTTGAGADRPEGIVTGAVVGVTAAATGAVTTDELINIEYAVDEAYIPGASWMFHRNTARELRKLTDGDGRYIWQPGMQSGQPSTLNNYPFTLNSDMPTMATGNRAILFGQLSNYVIRDVRGFTLLTLRERYADQFQIAFVGFSRHDGKLIDAGGSPIQAIVMA